MSNSADRITEVLRSMNELLLEKNKRYGDAALTPANIFSKLDSGGSIRVRLDDKIKRIQNSDELRVNDICDIIGYLTLLLVSMGTKKEDILELID